MGEWQPVRTLQLNGMELYAGRWVAMVGDQVISQGGTPEQARMAAQVSRSKEISQVFYVPTIQPLDFPLIFHKIIDALPDVQPVYLVGGAVRDALLGRKIHDYDFVLPSNAVKLSRQVSKRLGAAFFPLDDEHDTGRMILISRDGNRLTFDFSAIRGIDLESDLRARDFTINAIAVDVRQPQVIFDPLGGVADLLSKQLHPCSPAAFINDPIRILRGIRQAAVFNFSIPIDTRKLMRAAASHLPKTSMERLRDELFRLLDSPRIADSIRALDILGALQYVLPEMESLKGIDQSYAHINDVWDHTLDVVQNLETILNALVFDDDIDPVAEFSLGLMVMQLGRYQQKLREHLSEQLNIDRSLRSLIFLAALYHDSGKPETRTLNSAGKVHFYKHDEAGSRIIEKRAQCLRLSNPEIDRVVRIVRGHLRPLLLENDGNLPTHRAVYRFFRELGVAGVDVCILALADFLGAYGQNYPHEKWRHHLNVIHCLLEAWWEHPNNHVTPPVLINGHELMKELGISPGPLVGKLLAAIREAQATGQIRTREDALEFVKSISIDQS